MPDPRRTRVFEPKELVDILAEHYKSEGKSGNRKVSKLASPEQGSSATGASSSSSSDDEASPLPMEATKSMLTGRKTVSVLCQDRQELRELLEERGGGSLLRGWRREMDPQGSLSVGYQEFVDTSERIGFTGNTFKLSRSEAADTMGTAIGDRDGQRRVYLADFATAASVLIDCFREWARKEFSGPKELYAAIDKFKKGYFDKSDFLEVCLERGLYATENEIEEIFNWCDLEGDGVCYEDDVSFIYGDHNYEKITEKICMKEQQRRLLAWVYQDDTNRQRTPTHRLAPRPWLAGTFERLPTVVRQQRLAARRAAYRRCLEARIAFLKHIRTHYGSEIRAWRNVLDPNAMFELPQQVLRQYCRNVDLPIDLKCLWKSLDKDCDGAIRLEELCGHVVSVPVLARFKMWAQGTFGSCSDMWDHTEMRRARSRPHPVKHSWASDKKMLVPLFWDAVKVLNWEHAGDHATRSAIISSLDVHGCGFISRTDLDWLDKWPVTEWLTAEPDEEAWTDLREMLDAKYKHPLHAWVNLFDQDHSNNVSWLEFKEACELLKFDGNVVGAWRWLDRQLRGEITMKQYDQPTADLLGSFKDWAEANFGSCKLAFKALCLDWTGLTLHDLKRACRHFGWTGRVRLLFDLLRSHDIEEGVRPTLRLKDVEFLDSWDRDRLPEEMKENELVAAALQADGPASSAGTQSPYPSPLSSPAKKSRASFSPLSQEMQQFGIKTSTAESLRTLNRQLTTNTLRSELVASFAGIPQQVTTQFDGSSSKRRTVLPTADSKKVEPVKQNDEVPIEVVRPPSALAQRPSSSGASQREYRRRATLRERQPPRGSALDLLRKGSTLEGLTDLRLLARAEVWNNDKRKSRGRRPSSVSQTSLMTEPM